MASLIVSCMNLNEDLRAKRISADAAIGRMNNARDIALTSLLRERAHHEGPAPLQARNALQGILEGAFGTPILYSKWRPQRSSYYTRCTTCNRAAVGDTRETGPALYSCYGESGLPMIHQTTLSALAKDGTGGEGGNPFEVWRVQAEKFEAEGGWFHCSNAGCASNAGKPEADEVARARCRVMCKISALPTTLWIGVVPRQAEGPRRRWRPTTATFSPASAEDSGRGLVSPAALLTPCAVAFKERDHYWGWVCAATTDGSTGWFVYDGQIQHGRYTWKRGANGGVPFMSASEQDALIGVLYRTHTPPGAEDVKS